MTVDGMQLAYRDQGQGEAVLLLHSGFVADGMLPLFEEPSLAAFRLISYHRRGYGDSDRAAGPVSMDRHAHDASEVLDRLGVTRAHVVGHSIGAVVALQMALDAPGRIGGLVLMEPLLGFALDPAAAQFVADTASVALPRFAAGDQAGALDAWLTGAFGPGYRPLLDRGLPGAWETAVTDAPTAFGAELPALQQWPVGPDDLATIQAPTLSVVNCEDRWPGFRQTHELLLARVPRCEGVVVEVPTHLLQIAAPTPVAEAVAAWLVRHPLPV